MRAIRGWQLQTQIGENISIVPLHFVSDSCRKGKASIVLYIAEHLTNRNVTLVHVRVFSL